MGINICRWDKAVSMKQDGEPTVFFIGKHPNSIRFRAEFTKEAHQMIISPNINVDLWVKLIQREGEVNLSLMGIGISVYMPILQ